MPPSNELELLHRACERGDRSIVSKVLKKGGKDLLKQVGQDYGQTALHICCENQREELIQYILERFSSKVDINATEKNGWTPLHIACEKGNLNIVELLVTKGAYIRAVTNNGSSPLHYLVRHGDQGEPLKHSKIMKQMVETAYVDSQNNIGETPLHQAAMRDRFLNVSYLVNAKADPNKKTRKGQTPLHFAVKGNCYKSASILLQASADPTIVSDEGTSILSLIDLSSNTTNNIRMALLEWYIIHNKEIPIELEEKDVSSELHKRKKKLKKSSEKLAPPNSAPNLTSRTTSKSPRTDGESGEKKFSSVQQRIDKMQQRAAVRDASRTQPSEPISSGHSRVNSLVSEFESLSPTSARRAESSDSATRIQKLKQKASKVVDVQAIEDRVDFQSPTVRDKQKNIVRMELDRYSSLSSSSLKNQSVQSSLERGWTCKMCNIDHTSVPLFLFFASPEDYESLDGTEKANRAKLSSDLCCIESTSSFYVRGLLEIPVHIAESSVKPILTWGLWIKVSQTDFDSVVANWSTENNIEMDGTINNSLSGYSGSYGMKVKLTTRSGGLRPIITLKDDSTLSKDQEEGLSAEKVSNLLCHAFQSI